jgi:hypothetical protein
MKNLIVYISPAKDFIPECQILAKIQIDNCHRLGWKPEDVLLVTNWDYEYNGIKSIVVGEEHYCPTRPRSLKTSIIPALYDLGVLEKGTIYWNHDFDAFQVNQMKDEDLGEGYDAWLTDYGWRDRWCMGSFFFKDTAKDIFALAKPKIFQNIEDETVFMELMQDPEIAKRCKRLNVTYNMGQRHITGNLKIIEKPLRVVHFHPNRQPLLDIFKTFLPADFLAILKEYKYE